MLETKISIVTIFREGARVTRSGSITLPAGEHILTINGLPRSLDKDSVRVKGTGRGSIQNINLEEKYEDRSPQEALDALKNQIEQRDETLQDLQRQKELLLAKRASTETLQDRTHEEFPKYFLEAVKFEDFRALNDHLFQTIESCSRQIQDLDRKVHDVQLEREKLRHQMDQLGYRHDVEESFEVKVTLLVQGPGEGKFDLTVSYILRDARWSPLYDAIIEEGQTTIKLMANVVNFTTEDWEKVHLEVSTATIAPVRAVKPDPLVIREYSPYYGGYPGAALSGKREKLEEKEKKSKEDAIPVTEVAYSISLAPKKPKPTIKELQADVSENVGVQSFKLPAPVSIPSDKEPHPVTLTTTKLSSKKKLYWSVANPGIVVAQETITNGDLILLPGKVKCYFQDEYLGESEIPLISPQQDFNLGSRTSYEITVDKKMVDRAREKTGFMKGKISREYSYQIKIKNSSKVECPLKLVDRIPHSDSEKIRVDPDFGATKPDKVKLGISTWNFDLAGVTEKTLTYSYVVSYDKDVQVTPPLP